MSDMIPCKWCTQPRNKGGHTRLVCRDCAPPGNANRGYGPVTIDHRMLKEIKAAVKKLKETR